MGSGSRISITGCLCLAGVASVLLTIFADAVLLRELKRSYHTTEAIVCGIAGEGESGDALLKYLKEAPDKAFLQSGARHMAAYGYGASAPTVWELYYRDAKKRVIASSVLFDALLLLLFCFLALLHRRQAVRRVYALEHALFELQGTDGRAFDSDPDLEDVLQERVLSLQKQIQTSRTQMQQEKESTKRLVTDISHQLKTPVAALKTSLELLNGEEMTEAERQEFLAGCIRQLDCLENLTAALVGVSRMEKGMIQIHAAPAPIKDAILSAVSRLYEKAADKQISIELCDGGCAETTDVMHDKKWTAEVFCNLLDNAVKYSGPHSKIRIRTEELVSYVRISVEDEGIGIPQEERTKIFKRFYRGRQARCLEGSGVGLYLAREIIERQNGTIFVLSRSKTQAGSVFSVQLPKA